MTDPNTDALSQIFSSLFAEDDASIQSRLEALLSEPEIVDVLGSIEDLNPEHFDLLFNLPLRECTEALISHALPETAVDQPRLLFLFSHAEFVEIHFQRLFQQYEGPSGAAEKSRTILRALAHFLATGVPIQFDYSGPETLHLPERIFVQHQAIFDFYEGLYRLYHGQPELYLEALGRLLDQQGG